MAESYQPKVKSELRFISGSPEGVEFGRCGEGVIDALTGDWWIKASPDDLKTGWKRQWNKEGHRYHIKDYGAKSDGVTDDWIAISSAITAANAGGGGTVVFPEGITKCNFPITLLDKVYLAGQGMGATTLDLSAAAPTIASIYATGSLTQLPNLSGNVTSNARSITLESAPSISPQDVYLIWNKNQRSWSDFGDRYYYYAGEFF